MVDNTFERELLDAIRQLTASQQQDVLKYARSMRGRKLSAPSGAEFVARLKDIHIPKEDLEEMKQAIEDCEKIDWDEWDVDIFD